MSNLIQNAKKKKINEFNIVSIIRSSRKNKIDSSHLKYGNNNKHNKIRKKSNSKSKELSASSTLSTFRKGINLHNSTGSLSQIRSKTKNAVNINTNNNEINIHLSLNSDNINNSSLHLEDMLKQKDALISKLQNELESNHKILYKLQAQEINKHSRHNKSTNDLNFFLTKTKSSGFISSKASKAQTVTLFNNIIKKRVKSPIGFSVEKTKKNVYDSLGKLKTISIKTQRIYKRKSKAKIMSNEMISKICKNVLERTKKICEMYNDICECSRDIKDN